MTVKVKLKDKEIEMRKDLWDDLVGLRNTCNEEEYTMDDDDVFLLDELLDIIESFEKVEENQDFDFVVKPGDLLVLKDSLKVGEDYGGIIYIAEMEARKDQKIVKVDIDNDEIESLFTYSHHMLNEEYYKDLRKEEKK